MPRDPKELVHLRLGQVQHIFDIQYNPKLLEKVQNKIKNQL